jgi:hypothetical protein
LLHSYHDGGKDYKVWTCTKNKIVLK